VMNSSFTKSANRSCIYITLESSSSSTCSHFGLG
jgi:hypothetical protein